MINVWLIPSLHCAYEMWDEKESKAKINDWVIIFFMVQALGEGMSLYRNKALYKVKK